MQFFQSFDGIVVEHHSGQIRHVRTLMPYVGRFARAGTVSAAIAVAVDGTAYRIDHETALGYATPASLVQSHRYDPQSRLAVTMAGNRIARLEFLPRHRWPADMPVPAGATVTLTVNGTPWPMAHQVEMSGSGID